jgi:uncharacterized sulfatase
MDRRRFLKSSGAFLGGAMLGGLVPGSASAAKADGPDVLFIAIEDIAPYLSCYGHPVVQTPNMDALAARGVLFANAHCQAPICNPSRASVMTGLRPRTTGVHTNETDWRPLIPAGMKTLPEHFRDSGYETVTRGKMVHPESLFKEPHPDGQAREDAFWNRQLRPSGATKVSREPRRPGGELPDGLDPASYLVTSLAWGPSGQTDEQTWDGAIARAAADELRRPAERPRFIAIGLHSPHYPLRAPDRCFDVYTPDKAVLPDVPPDEMDDVPKPGRYWWHRRENEWLTEQERREVIAAYYCTIAHVDTCVGWMLDALRESGRERETIVCLWGDHGLHMGRNGLWRKWTLFDGSTHVPFIIAAPGVAPRGAVCTRPAELIDIYPTLADLCGIGVPEGLEGISMRPVLETPDGPWKRAALTSRGEQSMSLRTERYRYTEWDGPEQSELYDHETDPGEHTNLAGDPANAAVQAELAGLMARGWRGALP